MGLHIVYSQNEVWTSSHSVHQGQVCSAGFVKVQDIWLNGADSANQIKNRDQLTGVFEACRTIVDEKVLDLWYQKLVQSFSYRLHYTRFLEPQVDFMPALRKSVTDLNQVFNPVEREDQDLQGVIAPVITRTRRSTLAATRHWISSPPGR